jgi:hypothetical protein
MISEKDIVLKQIEEIIKRAITLNTTLNREKTIKAILKSSL